jgi:outer membrane immunogenic protein
MNKYTVAICLLLLAVFVAVPANAGDYKGFYAGANLGGVSANSNAFTHTVFSPTGYFASSSVPAIAAVGVQNPTPSSFTGGGQVGYNFQSHAWVVGIETDFGGMPLSDVKVGTATYPCCAPTAFTVRQTVETSWLYTLRPRLGFTSGPVLIYGTGGLAVTNLQYQSFFTDTFATAAESKIIKSNQTGWAAGAGAEFKVGPKWSLKGEYLHADFGSVNGTSTNLTAFTPPIAFPTNVFTHSADLTANIYRFGFNYRF